MCETKKETEGFPLYEMGGSTIQSFFDKMIKCEINKLQEYDGMGGRKNNASKDEI